jgi:hypothetical protein
MPESQRELCIKINMFYLVATLKVIGFVYNNGSYFFHREVELCPNRSTGYREMRRVRERLAMIVQEEGLPNKN